MRVRIRGRRAFAETFEDAFVALHDGLLNGDVRRIGRRRIDLRLEQDDGLPDLDLRLNGRRFQIDGEGEGAQVRDGRVTEIVVREVDAPARERIVFDRFSLSLVELDRAIRRTDRGGAPEDAGTLALWNLLAGLGFDHVSPGGEAERMESDGGPGFVRSLGLAIGPWGLDGDDRVRLTGLADVWHAGGGDDRVSGRGGDDRLHGDGGDDALVGGRGRDTIFGGDGGDRLKGGGQGDQVYGGGGEDRIVFGGGADFGAGDGGGDEMLGGGGRDTLQGGRGKDRIEGGGGADSLAGGDGRDRIFGGGGNDTLEGGGGGDVLRGQGGDDMLTDDVDNQADDIYPGAFKDRMDGGAGDDQLSSFAGNDVLTGGRGRDLFEFWYGQSFFGSGPNVSEGMSARVTDYDPRRDDVHVDRRALDAFRQAGNDAAFAGDEDWWRAFFFPDPDGDGAVFRSREDGFRLEIDGMAATKAEFDALFT